MATLRLFVYGTLKPGERNAHELERVRGEWSKARIRGTLFEIASGENEGCPGLTIDDQGDDIPGYVLASEELADEWPRLDAFEGEGYERVLARVTLDSGEAVDAWVYVVTPRET